MGVTRTGPERRSGGRVLSIAILAIETSCDETAVAVVEDGVRVLADSVHSQVPDHRKYGGVVPEVASRRHLETVNPLMEEALARAGLGWPRVGAVAVTYGPGLVGALLVGVTAAKALAFALERPLVGVNHLEGHVYANFLVRPDLRFPLLALVVSGGHTDLVLMAGHGRFALVGGTRDDAAGEAFDKVARLFDLGYPGGPAIEKAGAGIDPGAVSLPRAYLEPGSLDFSFSGLKTAAARLKQRGLSPGVIAAAFQRAVVDVLVDKTMTAAGRYGVGTVLLAGGVAANGLLRSGLADRAEAAGLSFGCPPRRLCTDNAAMIGCAAYYRFLRGDFAGLDLNAVPGLALGD